MLSFFQHRGGHYVLLALVALPMFFWNLGAATLWDLDEGRNLTCAYEMMLSENWIVPTFNGELRDHKPVLLYWLQMFFYSIGGVNETMGRLPSALAGLLTLFVVYELGRRMFSKSTGLLAGLAAATTPMLIGASRFANPDGLLNLFTATTMLLAWMNMNRPRLWTNVLLGASIGMAVLAKGPVGLLLPCAILVAYAVWERRWAMFFDVRVVWTAIAFVAVAAPWYILVGVITHAHFLKGFFFTHHVDRFLSTMENHRGSILYYPIVLLAGSIPWSLFAAGTVWATYWSCWRGVGADWHTPWDRFQADQVSYRQSRFFYPLALMRGFVPGLLRIGAIVWTGFWNRVPGGEPNWQATFEKAADPSGRGGVAAYRFLTAWTLVYLAFFSISATKLPNYVLPVIVPWTLLSARFLDRWRKETLTLPTWYLRTAVVSLALLGVGVSVGLAVASGVGELGVMRNRFLPGLWPFAFMGLAPVIAAGFLWTALQRNRRATFVNSFVLAAGLFLAPLAACATAALNAVKASESISHTPAGRTDLDLRVVGFDVAHLPSLNFYLKRDVRHAQALGDVLQALHAPLPTIALIPEAHVDAFQNGNAGFAVEIGRFADMYRGKKLIVFANPLAARE
ncbi:MAG: glycosyltransferase family 39 protein [Planctomycetota bacterium]